MKFHYFSGIDFRIVFFIDFSWKKLSKWSGESSAGGPFSHLFRDLVIYVVFMLMISLKTTKAQLVVTRSQLYEQLRPRSKMQNAQNYILYIPGTPSHAYPDEKGTL